ncbi:MAG: alpha/beta fold hydrolase [Gemmatimonadota bacterium]
MSRSFSKLVVLAASLAFTTQVAYAQRTFAIDDIERIRQPAMTALAPDGAWLSYVLGDTLWLVSTDGRAEARAVSAGMANQINYAQPFHAWSPGSDRLLYRTGNDGVRGQGVPMIHDVSTGRERPLLPAEYRDRLQTFVHWAADGPAWSPDGSTVSFPAADTAAESAQHLNLYTVDVSTRSVSLIAADTAGPIGGIASAAWSPDGRWLAYGTGTFGGDAGRLVLRRSDGTEEIVLEAGAPMYRHLSWSPDGDVLSALRHDGNRILLRIGDDGESRLLTDSVPLTRHDWTTDGRLLGTRSMGMSSALVTWTPERRDPAVLTRGDTLFRLVGVGVRGRSTLIAFSKESGDLPLDVWAAELPSSGRRLRAPVRLTNANPWLDSLALARARIRSWAGPDGDTLRALLFLPPETVAAPPYPLVVRPYGGYTNEFPKSEYFMDAGTQLLTARGWAVVLPNTRGMSGNPLTGRYGEVQLADTRLLIEDLAADRVIDAERVAVIGHSHGGALAYYYLTHDDGFCAVGAVNGWSDWSQIAGRLQATEDELSAKLERHSPIRNVYAVSAPLLAVSGANDTQVRPENAERMVAAMRRHGKSAEWLHFEDEGHLLTRRTHRRTFWTRVLEFFEENC